MILAAEHAGQGPRKICQFLFGICDNLQRRPPRLNLMSDRFASSFCFVLYRGAYVIVHRGTSTSPDVDDDMFLETKMITHLLVLHMVHSILLCAEVVCHIGGWLQKKEIFWKFSQICPLQFIIVLMSLCTEEHQLDPLHLMLTTLLDN